MSTEPSSHPRRFSKLLRGSLAVVGTIAILLIILSVVLTVLPKHFPFQSAAELERIRADMAVAKARWETNAILNYDIDVRVVVHMGACSSLFGGKPTTLHIRQGQLVITEEVRRQKLEDGCHVSTMLPPQAFETVNEWLGRVDPNEDYTSIEFDPEYGFMTRYFLTSNNSTSDLYVSYEFSNFRPIEATNTP